MTNTLPTLGDNGVTPALWNALIQQINSLGSIVAGNATNQTRMVVDGYGNCTAIIGQLDQTVTEGASFGNPGSQSTTGLTGFGIAVYSSGSWVVLPSGGGGGSVDTVTAGDLSIVVGGTTANPTVETGTLDEIASLHAPAANWSNNSKKITSLANGSGAQDAAAFGQIPASLPPNGTAGGSLAGTYPNPTIESSVSLPGSPTTTTQSPLDNSTKVATTAYTDLAVAATISEQALGSLGSSKTLTLTSRNTQATGTLTANCALTVSGLTAGCSVVLLLLQNSTGGWTLTINGSAAPINPTPSIPVNVCLYSPNGTDLWVVPEPASGPQGLVGPAGSPLLNVNYVTGTTTAVSGNWYEVNGPYTINLPSPVVANRVVAVTNVGASTVTVSTGTGDIFGLGVPSGASSILLGVTNATVTLQSDGYAWVIVAGAQDSGWLTIANGSMYNSWVNTSPAFGYRLVGNVVRMRGGFTGGATANQALQLPSGYWPATTIVLTCNAQGSGVYSVATANMSTAGQLTPYFNVGVSPPIYVDGLSFTVD